MAALQEACQPHTCLQHLIDRCQSQGGTVTKTPPRDNSSLPTQPQRTQSPQCLTHFSSFFTLWPTHTFSLFLILYCSCSGKYTWRSLWVKFVFFSDRKTPEFCLKVTVADAQWGISVPWELSCEGGRTGTLLSIKCERGSFTQSLREERERWEGE